MLLRSLVVVALLLAGATGRTAAAADAFTVMERDPVFSIWVTLINVADLEGYARGARRSFTLFAPVNDSFAAVAPATLQQILPRAVPGGIDISRTVFVVQSHVINGIHEPAEFRGKTATLASVNKLPVVIDATRPDKVTVRFETATGYVSGPPIRTSNALIYPVTLTELRYEPR